MPLYGKVLIIVGAVLTIGLLSLAVYRQNEMSNRQTAIEAQVVSQKQLVDGIMRSQNEYATRKDIEQFVKDNGVNLKAIQADLSKLHAEITNVNVVTTTSKGQISGNLPTTSKGPANPTPDITPTCKDGSVCINADPYGYLKNQQNFALNEEFGKVKVPFGVVGFSAWQPEPWSLNIKPREYHVSTVTGTDENQRAYVYNKFTMRVDGVDFEIPIETATTKQEYPEAVFSWWNPRIFFGIDSGVNLNKFQAAVSPNVEVGFMSYGRYKNQPDFSFLQVGMGYDMLNKTPEVVVTPITYNIGKHIPLMTNLHIGPSLSLGFNGDFAVMFGFRIGL